METNLLARFHRDASQKPNMIQSRRLFDEERVHGARSEMIIGWQAMGSLQIHHMQKREMSSSVFPRSGGGVINSVTGYVTRYDEIVYHPL